MLQDLFSPDSIHYVTLLGITRVADHSKCTSIGKHIDNNVYQTQHVEAGCECQLIEANQDQVISILDSGGLPIVGRLLPPLCAAFPHSSRSIPGPTKTGRWPLM